MVPAPSHSQSLVDSSKAAPTLFGIFFSLLLSYAFQKTEDSIYVQTRCDGRLFNLARLRSKTKTRTVLIRERLFADDAALAAPSEQALQGLVDLFNQASRLLKTEIFREEKWAKRREKTNEERS